MEQPRDRFASFDGVKIAYRVVRPDGASADASFPPVVLHHGFASDSETNWVRPGVSAALAGAGHEVVMIDARGHGDSEKPHDPAAYAGGAMTRDVELLTEHLGLERFDLVGYSMGAFVSSAVARTEFGRDQIRRLVLGGAGVVAEDSSGAAAARSARIAEALEAEDPASIADASARAFRSFADATGADRLALAAIQRSRLRPPVAAELHGVSVPTLVVNGERDTLVGEPDALARSIPGSRFVSVPGDHLSAVVKPEFAAAIVEFLGTP